MSVNSKQLPVNSERFTAYCLLLTAYYLLLTLLLPIHSARAHGGGTTQVSAAAAGPYRVTVWTAPQPVRAETPLHVTVAVADDDQRPVLDAAVLVELYAAGGDGPLVSGVATTAQSTNKLFYEVDFSPPATGSHRTEIAITGAAGEGAVAFNLDIQPPRNSTWLVLALAALALLAALGLFKGSPAHMPTRPSRKQGIVD